MIYTANQPLFFPHIYMMNRYANVDHLVHMNEAQYTRSGHQARVELLDKTGNVVLLRINLKDRSFKSINEVELFNADETITTIIRTVQMLYGAQPAYRKLKDSFVGHLEDARLMFSSGTVLSEFDEYLLRWVLDVSGVEVVQHVSDRLLKERPEHPSEWMSELGVAINCKRYLGGAVAINSYVRASDFDSRGLDVIAQNYKMSPYKRGSMYSDRATVSCLDPLFYGGPELLQELINVPAY